MCAKVICILTPCRNERENVRILHKEIREVMAEFPEISYRHLFVDNASTDGTQNELRKLGSDDSKVMVIINQRNFGHVRSPYHGLLQALGDAVIVMASDLQDPPKLIPEFLRLWSNGNLVVLGQKKNSAEARSIFWIRKAYYRLVNRLADVDLPENVTGFGLYDRRVIESFESIR